MMEDNEEVLTAEWRVDRILNRWEDERRACSSCGEHSPVMLVGDYFLNQQTPYCPWCGAKMKNGGHGYGE